MFLHKLLCFSVFVYNVQSVYYETFTGNKASNATVANMDAVNLIPWCVTDIQKCDPHELRRMDLSCNNLHEPIRGAAMTPFARMLPPMFGGDGWKRTAVSGKPLPNVRAVRVAIISDGRIASRRYTQMVTHFKVFVTGDITSVHDTANYVTVSTHCCSVAGKEDPRCNPIEVYPDDVHLRRSGIRCLNLTTAITYSRLGCVPSSAPRERINTAAPLLDLSIVYGHSSERAIRAREMAGGRLTAEVLKGKEWPPDGGSYCINNEPPKETRCHDAAAGGVNSVLGLNIFYMWFFRNHNVLARILGEMNPCWNDDRLYYTAREINIAIYNQILFYEFMPAVAGREFLIRNGAIHDTMGHLDDYDPKLMPTTSIDYVTTSRWYHSMQEGRLRLYTKDGRLFNELAVVDLTLRTGIFLLNNTLEGITQGSFRQPCSSSEVVDPDMGERVLGRLQLASDVISSDIMKTRDFGLPPYVVYRAACGLPVPKHFKDLLEWMDREKVEALSLNYESVEDIDIQVGILAERPMPGVALGPTFACITVDQMKRWRQSDRFWYENSQHPGAFSTEQLYEIRKMSLAKLVCENADQVDQIQPAAFLIISDENKLTSCTNIQGPDFNAWKDSSCSSKEFKHSYTEAAKTTKTETQGWERNPFLTYNDILGLSKSLTPDQHGFMSPYLDDNTPIHNKHTNSEISPQLFDSGHLMHGMIELPSKNMPFHGLQRNSKYDDQINSYSNIKTNLSPIPKIYQSLTARNSHLTPQMALERLKKLNAMKRHEIMKNNVSKGFKVASSNVKEVEDHGKFTKNTGSMTKTKTQPQAEFLSKISKKGQPGFEEFGFFAALPEKLKLVGAESLENIKKFAPRNIRGKEGNGGHLS